jgi:ssDNA-binding Zn-finger/Zn-ribbon topoisomerase 1
MLIRRSTSYCPNCNAGSWVEAGILADDQQYRCDNCGAMIDIKMKWGKIKSVSLAPTVKEGYKGYGGASVPRFVSDEARVGNVEYWKRQYGDSWLQAHDEFMRNHDKWLKEHQHV